MDYKDLAKQLKDNKLSNIYLFYGEEQYLIDFYTNEVKQSVLSMGPQSMNYALFSDTNATKINIIEFCDSFPVMSDKKLLIVDECEYFKGKKTSDVDELKEYLSDVPEYVHIIFRQKDLDKKSSLYKFMQSKDALIEFKKLDSTSLTKWCIKQIKQEKKDIEANAADYLVQILESDMQKIKNECLKLVSFAGDRELITIDDVKNVCKKSVSYEVFEMVDNIAQKDIKAAIIQLREILNSKESEIKILGLIIWNIRTLLKVKLGLQEGLPSNILSKRLGIGFINKYLNQTKNFSVEKLQDALIKCSNADLEMKTTGIDNSIILEKLIIEIAS